MLTTQLKYGIPDVDLPLTCGGTVNPSCFAGHQLVVLFLPKDRGRQNAECESYNKIAAVLSGTDAWILVIGDEPHRKGDTRTRVALDPDEKAWRAFKEVAGDSKTGSGGGRRVLLYTRRRISPRVAGLR